MPTRIVVREPYPSSPRSLTSVDTNANNSSSSSSSSGDRGGNDNHARTNTTKDQKRRGREQRTKSKKQLAIALGGEVDPSSSAGSSLSSSSTARRKRGEGQHDNDGDHDRDDDDDDDERDSAVCQTSKKQQKQKRQRQDPYRIQDELSQMAQIDIVGSRQLVGYMFCFTSSLVLFISSLKFYQNSLLLEEDEEDNDDENTNHSSLLRIQNNKQEFFRTARHSILVYKMYAAIAWGAGGMFYNLIIVVVHFDKRCVPQLWRLIFRDGSKWERNLMFFLIVFWMGGVYVCTSTFSVGLEQINVFFSSWISLITVLLNYDVWRISAGLTSVYDILASHYRKTTIHWTAALFCSCVAILTAIDLYLEHRAYDDPELYDYFGIESVSNREWKLAFVLTGVSAVVSFISLLLNFTLPLRPARVRAAFCTIEMHWRYMEGLFLLGIIGISSYLGFSYTGVGEVVGTPSNGYFGLWGLLFSAILGFGDWIGENKELTRDLPAVMRPRVSYVESSPQEQGESSDVVRNSTK